MSPYYNTTETCPSLDLPVKWNLVGEADGAVDNEPMANNLSHGCAQQSRTKLREPQNSMDARNPNASERLDET